MVLSAAALAWPAPVFDWQPARTLAEPWRAFTALFIHWSDAHLLANLGAAAAVAAYGFYAPVGAAQTAALAAAWPLTHLLLGWIKPELVHYGGLSGVLHAGVAIVSLTLVLRGTGGRRWVGAAVLLGLAIKIASEAPWGPALQRTAEFDIAVAPAGHLAGAIVGLACGALALCRWPRQSIA